MFDTFQQFDGVYKQVTANNGCMVLDKTQTSGKVNDCVFYYKANLNLPGFTIGKRFYFEMDRKLRTIRENSDQATTKILAVPNK
jgi:hypothetical protein